MPNEILVLLAQFGIGSIVGVIIGTIIQYFTSKKILLFETKLSVARKLYNQLNYFVLLNQDACKMLEHGDAVNATKIAENSGLDLKKELGDILYYADKELEKMINALIYNLYEESAIINKKDLDDITKIMKRLKKII